MLGYGGQNRNKHMPDKAGECVMYDEEKVLWLGSNK
jgi:hypothetical protein